MMSPTSGVVLGAAAVISSPALWLALVEGSLPVDVALTRYLVAIVVSWVALSLVSALAWPTPAPQKSEEEGRNSLHV